MRKLFAAAVITAAVLAPARADDAKTDPAAVIDKAAKALGGADKLKAAAAAHQTKAKITISVMGMDLQAETSSTARGTDHARSEFSGDFGGMKIEGITVLAGDKGWRSMNGSTEELDAAAMATEKRNAYLGLAATNPTVLQGKGFKVAAAADEKVDGKPAAVLAGTGPDGKAFKVYFDKESGLPVKVAAPNVAGFMGDEADQEWLFTDYKDFGGLKRPGKTTITRGGEKFITQELTDYKTLDKADPKLFEKP